MDFASVINRINKSMLNVSRGEYEVRYIDNDKKVVGVEIVDVCPYSSSFKTEINGVEVNPLVSSNPMSKEMLWDEDSFTKDEKRIKRVERIVLDIDYDFDRYAYDVMYVLNKEFGLDYDSFILYKSVSGKIHLYITVRQNEFDTVDAIKIAKVLVYKINQALKEKLGIELDNTFVHNFGHYIFAEEFFLPIKDNRKSVLMQPSEIRNDNILSFPLRMFKHYLEEYDEIFRKKKNKESKSNGGSGKKRSRRDYAVLTEEQKERVKAETTLYNNMEFKNPIRRDKKIKEANIGQFYKRLNEVSGSDIVSIDLNSIKSSKLYRDLLEYEEGRELTALIRWFTEGMSFLKKKMFKHCYYDEVYEGNKNEGMKKTEYRYQNVIFPVIQSLVDVFGKEFVRKSNLYLSVLDVFFAHNMKVDKENIIEDLEIALSYADEDNKDRLVDDDYRAMFDKKFDSNTIIFYRLLDDMINGKIGEILDNGFLRIQKKDLKEKYSMSSSKFTNFKALLSTYKENGIISYKEESRYIDFEYITHPFAVFYYELITQNRRAYIGRFNFRFPVILKEYESVFMPEREYEFTVFDNPLTNNFFKRLYINLVKRGMKVKVNVLKETLKHIETFIDFYIMEFKENYNGNNKNLFVKLLSRTKVLERFIEERLRQIEEIYYAVMENDKYYISFNFSEVNRDMAMFVITSMMEFETFLDLPDDMRRNMVDSMRFAFDKYREEYLGII